MTPVAGPYRMTPFETAIGWVPGYVSSPRVVATGLDPVRALEDAMLPALRRTPCLVAFSGGRDSSAVLAVAVALARREGLPLPIACTHRYPGCPELDETAWQEAVIRHLGVTDWELITVTDEHDALGPYARRMYEAVGLVFPPAAYTREMMNDRARGGAVITGEGGDEILGVKRSWLLANVVARRGWCRPRTYRGMVGSFAPGFLRRRAAIRRPAITIDWLRPAVAEQYVRLLAADGAGEPFDFAAATLRLLDRRALVEGLQVLDLLAARNGVLMVHPLLDRRFVAAWARSAGRLGPTSRTAAMRTLFGPMLPPVVISRRSKAVFNEAFFGPHARAFATEWDGTGVDPGLVDPDVLRAQWLSARPHGCSVALLQQAAFARG